MKENTEEWGIIGGGILGMTLALKLAQHGKKVSLFEASEKVGGLTTPWQLGNIQWDKFYHVILNSDKHLINLLRELNIENKIEWVETKTGFYTDGQLFSMSNSMEFLKFPPLSLFSKLRLAFTIFYASKIKNWKRLESVYVEDWLKKLSGAKTFDKIWLPLLKSKLGENYKETSAAFIWATIQRMYSARRSGLKKEMFGYMPEGYTRILKTFEEKLLNDKIAIHTNYSVKSIKKDNTKIEGEFTNGEKKYFDKIILTIPSAVASKICCGLSNEEKNKLNNIKYLGVVCPSIILSKPLSNFYVTNITDSGLYFTGVIEMSALVDKKYFEGKSLVYLPKYVTPNDDIFNLTDEEIKSKFLQSLFRIYPKIKGEEILDFKVAKAKYVFALSTLNYSKKLSSITTSIPGIYILNSSHIVNGTLNVNETIQLANNFMTDFVK